MKVCTSFSINRLGALALAASMLLSGYLWREKQAMQAELEEKEAEISALARREGAADAAAAFLEKARNEANEKRILEEKALADIQASCGDISDDEYFERLAGMLRLSFGDNGGDAAGKPLRPLSKAGAE